MSIAALCWCTLCVPSPDDPGSLIEVFREEWVSRDASTLLPVGYPRSLGLRRRSRPRLCATSASSEVGESTVSDGTAGDLLGLESERERQDLEVQRRNLVVQIHDGRLGSSSWYLN